MAHADSVIRSEGANDNMASAIVAMMLAQAFAGERPGKSLTFIITGQRGVRPGRGPALRETEDRGGHPPRRSSASSTSTPSPTGRTCGPRRTTPKLMALVRRVHEDLGSPTVPIYDESPCWHERRRPLQGPAPGDHGDRLQQPRVRHPGGQPLAGGRRRQRAPGLRGELLRDAEGGGGPRRGGEGRAETAGDPPAPAGAAIRAASGGPSPSSAPAAPGGEASGASSRGARLAAKSSTNRASSCACPACS